KQAAGDDQNRSTQDKTFHGIPLGKQSRKLGFAWIPSSSGSGLNRREFYCSTHLSLPSTIVIAMCVLQRTRFVNFSRRIDFDDAVPSCRHLGRQVGPRRSWPKSFVC